MSILADEKLHSKTSNYVRLMRGRHVDPATGCWVWMGRKDGGGYGAFRLSLIKKQIAVHRLSLALFMGFDPQSDLKVCHRCDNPPCFNPDHLFVGTQSENVADMVKKGRQHRGERVGRSTMTKDVVLAMRELRSRGISYRKIARMFGHSYAGTRSAIIGRTWGHVHT